MLNKNILILIVSALFIGFLTNLLFDPYEDNKVEYVKEETNNLTYAFYNHTTKEVTYKTSNHIIINKNDKEKK